MNTDSLYRDKYPPILVLPFALAGAIVLAVVYALLAFISLFTWGRPAKFISRVFGEQ